MALDFLTVAQGRVCALLGAECCVYMPDSCKNVKMGLQPVMQEIEKVQHPTGDTLQEWWTESSSTWRWTLVCVGGIASIPVVCCCSLSYCCGVQTQGLV